jgi:hypothetical protein
VSSIVAADSSDIGTTVTSLKTVLTQVASYVDGNEGSIASVLSNLSTFTTQVLSQQQQLSDAFQEGGLVLQNVNNALVTEPNGSTSLRIRYDPSLDTPNFLKEICGNELYRLTDAGLEQTKGSELNLACVASSVLAQIKAPPDAPEGPNLSLSALMAGAQ